MRMPSIRRATRATRVARIAALAVATASAGGAQSAATRAPAAAPAYAIVDGDSVHVYVFQIPPAAAGFTVAAGAPGAAPRPLTSEPVRPSGDYLAVRGILREQTDEILRSMDVLDEAALVRKIGRDPVAAGLLTIVYPRAGRLTGRRWSGLRPSADSVLQFSVTFVDAASRTVGAPLTWRASMRTTQPPPPTRVAVAPNEGPLRVTWAFAPRAAEPDITFGFNVYRAERGGEPVRLNPRLVVRDLDRAAVFDDADAQQGHTYAYSVRAVDMLGREGPASASLNFTYADKTAPAAPTELAATAGPSTVTVVWRMSPEADARGYLVERARSVNAAWTRVTPRPLSVDRPTYTDTTVTAGLQYFFRVIAVDSAGNLSAPSNPASALPTDREPPPAPTRVQAAVLPRHHVRISWLASPAQDLRGYNVYRNQVDGPVVRLNDEPVAALSFVDQGPDSLGLAVGRRYRIAVTAIDRASNESPMTFVEIAMPDDEPPGAPTGLTAANVLGRHVLLSWSSGGSHDVASYTIERSVDGGARTRVRDLPASLDRAHKDTAVSHGHRYDYWVTAVDSVGNRSAATRDSVRFGDFTPPPAPRNAYARASAAAPGAATVHWERVIDGELAGFAVYRSNLATGVYVKVGTVRGNVLEWTDPSSPRGAWYTVRAFDRSGNESAPSPAVKVPTP